MNGLIVINKPTNWTSRDVVNKLNKLLSTKKIGHTGTLDPLAEGVLVCLVGKYTKLGNLLTSFDKEYVAEIKLGLQTDTLDITGQVIEQKDFKVTKDQIANCPSLFGSQNPGEKIICLCPSKAKSGFTPKRSKNLCFRIIRFSRGYN